MRPLRYVSPAKFIELHGRYTPKAIQHKIDRGQWYEGQVIKRSPDGHINIDLEGFEKWVEGEQVTGSSSANDPSESASPGMADVIAKRSSSRQRQQTKNGHEALLKRFAGR